MRTQRGRLCFEIKPCPCFIGIDDEAGSGRSAPDGGDPVHIAIAAELDLEKRVDRSRGVAGGGFHDGRVGTGNGIGGGERAGRTQPSGLPYWAFWQASLP